MVRLLVALGLLLGSLVGAHAQVTFDAKNAAIGSCMTSGVCNNTTTTSITFTMTVGSIANGALVVPIMCGCATMPTLTVTDNSVAMTQVTGTATGTNGGCTCAGTIYALLAPASGAHIVSITWTGAQEMHATAVSFSGVNQTNVATAFPHGVFTIFNTSQASPYTQAITSATGNQVVAMAGQETSSWGTISGNLIAEDDTTGPQMTYASNYTSGAATVTPSFAFGTASIGLIVGTDVLASGGGGGGTGNSNLLLTGVGG